MPRSSKRTASAWIVAAIVIVCGTAAWIVRQEMNAGVQPLLVLPKLSVSVSPPPAQTIVATPTPIQTSVPATQPVPQQSAPAASWSSLLDTGTAQTTPQKPAEILTGNDLTAQAQARIAAGNLLDARTLLNDSLQSGRLLPADADAARSLLQQINQTLVFSPQKISDDPYTVTYQVQRGDLLTKIASRSNTTWQLLSRINHLDPRHLRYGTKIKLIRGPFYAVVRKNSYTLDAYLGALPGQTGSMYVTSFPVGLGKNNSTPTGLWAIAPHAKLLHPTYYPPEGGDAIDADDPKNPLGGYWIALTGLEGQAIGQASYGIHGTIDPASIGHQSSMGCIRLRHDDIALMFDLMVEGKSLVRVQE